MELVKGVHGHEGLYLNSHRVGGEKPWGGGSVIKRWRVSDAELQIAMRENQ